MAKTTVNYALELPKGSRIFIPSLEGLMQSFGTSVSIYFKREAEIKGRKPRGVSTETSGKGVGPSPDRAGQGQKGQDRFLVGPGGKRVRASVASSIRAIATRKGKFGETKLKSSTERKLRAKGFQIGKPTTVPRRPGQNLPKGRA